MDDQRRRRRTFGRSLNLAASVALTGLCVALTVEPLPGQESTGGEILRLSVEEAVARAVQDNEQVLISRAERSRTAGIVKEVRARSLPEINTSVAYNRNIQQPVLFFNTPEGTQQIQIGNANDYSFGLTFTQALFDPTLGAAQSAAKLSSRATAAQVEASRTEVARAARVAYYRVLLDRELVEVQERALEQAETRLQQVREFFQAGTASEFDLLTAQVEVDNIRPELIDARNSLALDRDELKRTIGVSLDREVALTDSLGRPAETVSLDTAVIRALAARADLQSQGTRVSLQRENLTAEKNEALPSLDLSASLMRRAATDELMPESNDFTQSLSAGFAFEVPLFDGRAREGRVQQARAELERERYRFQQLRKQVRLDVQQAHQSLVSAREQIQASEANVARAERALEIAQTRFQNGLSTQVELNDAELAVTRARTNYAQALFNYNVARTELMAAMGER